MTRTRRGLNWSPASRPPMPKLFGPRSMRRTGGQHCWACMPRRQREHEMKFPHSFLLERVAVVTLLIAAQFIPVHAEVVESGANGFALQRTVHIAANPERVFTALIQPAKWWDSEHTFSGNAANLSIDTKAGGCFCETWNGGSVQHLVVVNTAPRQTPRPGGALGPVSGERGDGA